MKRLLSVLVIAALSASACKSQEQKQAEEAAKRARAQFPIARNLEKMGKVAGALDFYREIVRHAPDSEEGRVLCSHLDDHGRLGG